MQWSSPSLRVGFRQTRGVTVVSLRAACRLFNDVMFATCVILRHIACKYDFVKVKKQRDAGLPQGTARGILPSIRPRSI